MSLGQIMLRIWEFRWRNMVGAVRHYPGRRWIMVLGQAGFLLSDLMHVWSERLNTWSSSIAMPGETRTSLEWWRTRKERRR